MTGSGGRPVSMSGRGSPAARRARDDRHSYAPPSRFLDAAALAVMEVEEHMRPTVPVAAVAVAAGTVEVDVSALWN